MVRAAVLVSGGGTNLQAIIDAKRAGKIPSAELALVVASNASAYALTRAETAGIAHAVLRKEKGEAPADYGERLLALLRENAIDVVVLAGFLTILPENVIRAYDHRILNIHPSLIPSFCGDGFYGLHVHEAALKRGVKVTGATVHFVNEITDGGDIIAQKAVEVLPGDTPETLQRRVMEQAEWILLPQALEQVAGEIAKKAGGKAMKKQKLNDVLSNNTYPGRGICLGVDENGEYAVIVYFIMGRSVNSRNRIFEETDDGIITKAHDESLMTDPHLIIYAPVRALPGGEYTIVTNGDQTDTIVDFLKQGKSYFEALRTRQFEPDAPNYTSRISGVVNPDGSYSLSILKNFTSDRTANKRFFYEYDKPVAGLGHFIHTYQCDGDPLFRGEPKCIRIELPIKEFTNLLWNSLNEQNKVSLFVRYVDLETGEYEQEIRNKNAE